jgi:ATP-binding cassette, subfamily B (MDR/TAP), member 1
MASSSQIDSHDLAHHSGSTEVSEKPPAGGVAIRMADEASSPQTAPRSTLVAEPEPKPGPSNFLRILSYASPIDRLFMGIGCIAAIGAGVTLPLMNVVFGGLVGNFNSFSVSNDGISQGDLSTVQSAFTANVDRNALYFVCLFIAKFVLGYISIFCFRMTGIRISAAIRLPYLQSLFVQSINAIDKLPPGAATDSLTSVAILSI